jgi:hypothetical protein
VVCGGSFATQELISLLKKLQTHLLKVFSHIEKQSEMLQNTLTWTFRITGTAIKGYVRIVPKSNAQNLPKHSLLWCDTGPVENQKAECRIQLQLIEERSPFDNMMDLVDG